MSQNLTLKGGGFNINPQDYLGKWAGGTSTSSAPNSYHAINRIYDEPYADWEPDKKELKIRI
jgi:hypothetical protein